MVVGSLGLGGGNRILTLYVLLLVTLVCELGYLHQVVRRAPQRDPPPSPADTRLSVLVSSSQRRTDSLSVEEELRSPATQSDSGPGPDKAGPTRPPARVQESEPGAAASRQVSALT